VGGIRNGVTAAMGYYQTGNRNEGPLGEFSLTSAPATIGGAPSGVNQTTDRIMTTRLSDVRDGTSNTFLIVEWSGRNLMYLANRSTVGFTTKDFTTDPAWTQFAFGGGGWGDPLAGCRMNGANYDGSGTSGQCGINCTNKHSNSTSLGYEKNNGA